MRHDSIEDYWDTRWLSEWPADRERNGFSIAWDHIGDLYRSARRAHRGKRYTRRRVRAHLKAATANL